MRRLRRAATEQPLNGVLAEVANGSKDPYQAALDILGTPAHLAHLIAGAGKAL